MPFIPSKNFFLAASVKIEITEYWSLSAIGSFKRSYIETHSTYQKYYKNISILKAKVGLQAIENGKTLLNYYFTSNFNSG